MPWEAKKLREFELPTAVLSVERSRDERTIWAACLDGGVWAVDAESGEHERVGSHASWASGVVRPETDGELVVSAGYDGALVWTDAAERREVRRVDAHGFWSWRLTASPRGAGAPRVASVSGQYLCGTYDYKPRPATEPVVKVFDAVSGALAHELDMLPPVLSCAFSPDGQHLAAGNLMGDVVVWSLATGERVAEWNTPAFTGWGIIKGHYYTGGIYGMAFTPRGDELIVCGMGSTTDPAAGNGRQLWQRFRWSEEGAPKVDETHDGESGQGLQEALAFAPHGGWFVMGGRVARGKWNVAFFDGDSGALLGSLETKTRVTDAVHSADGRTLWLGGAVGQGERQEDGGYRRYGRISAWALPGPTRAL